MQYKKFYHRFTVKKKTSAPHAVPTLVCQLQSFYLKILVKKVHNSESYSCLETAPCHDEQVFQV